MEAVTDDEIKAICRKLLDMAIGGDLASIKEFFDRTMGKPVAFDLLERVEQLELAELGED